MALLTQRDVKDVSDLVTKKLELYANREKRENGFDPSGLVRTTHKMYKYDFMYRVLEYDDWDRDSPRYPKKKKKGKPGTFEDENHGKTEEPSKDKKVPNINPKVLNTSRRMVLYKEVDRLASNAAKVFEEHPIDKLQVIHRYRPSYHGTVEDTPETGKVQNYTRHVGAVLKSQDYINYYTKEGLQSGKSNNKKSKVQDKDTKQDKETKEEEKADLKERQESARVEKKGADSNKLTEEKQKKVYEPTIKVDIKTQ